jgi:electron transfer flavoprotein beta subunit
MKIIATVKASPEAQDISAKPDRSLSMERAAIKWGNYDLNAVEAARVLADETSGTAIGLSVGTSALDNSKLRKDVLSRGLDELETLADDSYDGLDSFQTATLLADGVRQIGDVDLVLCGAGSSDQYNQEVGVQLGAILGWNTLNSVEAISVEGDHLVVERQLEGSVQSIEVGLPAVLSLTSSANTPRIAGMKEILAAGKKPTTQLNATAAVPAAAASTDSVLAPEHVARRQQLFDGEPAEAAAQLAAVLKAL